MAASQAANIPVNVAIVTLDAHMAAAAERAEVRLRQTMPGLRLNVHSTTDWGDDAAKARAEADVASADFVISNMMFMEDHINSVRPWMEARRDDCDAMVGTLSAGDIVKLPRLGAFDMSQPASGAVSLLRRLAGRKKGSKQPSGGARQMKMLRTLPRMLRFIPGKAQDVRAYFMAMQYMLAGSDENLENLVRFLIQRYASGPREALRQRVFFHEEEGGGFRSSETANGFEGEEKLVFWIYRWVAAIDHQITLRCDANAINLFAEGIL